MSSDPLDIDRIVREVLRRLQEAPSSASGSTSVAKAPEPKQKNGRHELRLAERVVAMAAIDGRLEGVRRLVLRRDAIITPAVKDVLRRRNIAIDWDDSQTTQGGEDPEVAVALAETDYDATPLLAQFGSSSQQKDLLTAAIQDLAERVRGDQTLGLLLTDKASLAVCLANRHSGVRAALGGNLNMVRDATHTVGANLLVIAPRGRSLAELLAVTREFIRGGPRACPPEYQDVL